MLQIVLQHMNWTKKSIMSFQVGAYATDSEETPFQEPDSCQDAK